MTRRRRVALLLAALSAALLPALPRAAAATTTVTTVGFNFVPPVVSVARGDSVELANADIVGHDLVSDDGKFASTVVPPNGRAPVTGVESLDAGVYAFHCSLHPNMHGVLTVSDAGAPPVPTPAPPSGGSVAVAGAVPTPSSLTVRDGYVYAASYVQGSVVRLPILAGGLLGPGETYASGFTNPLGIAFAPDGTLFVADSHPSSAPGRTTDGRVWAVAPDDARTRSIVVDGLPNGRHNTNGMAVHGGRLFVTNGSSTDDGVNGGDPEVPPLTGSLLSVPVTARGLTPSSADVVVEAKGMRNIYDVAFRDGTDEAWLPMNGPDTFDPYGEDLLLMAPVGDGVAEDFGFPGCIYAQTSTGTAVEQNPTVAATDPCDGTQRPPERLLGLHVSADGLAFAPDGQSVYVAEFGNFYGSSVTGHRVVRVPVDRTQPITDVLVGGVPLDVAFGPDGLYVADFAAGILLVPSGAT